MPTVIEVGNVIGYVNSNNIIIDTDLYHVVPTIIIDNIVTFVETAPII